MGRAQALEEELEGGPGSLPVPDPATAKITELTAYCKAVGQYPDGWTGEKADGKRVAFRRHFLGEATSTFDPSDPLHLIAEEVERMTAEQLAGAVGGMGEAVGFDYFRMGGALARIDEGLYASEFGCETFKDWLSRHTDLTYGKARNLIRCYVKLVELEVAWSRISDVGWTKVRMLVDVLDAESLDGWLEKARAMGKRELKDEVKAAKRGDRSSDPGEKSGAQAKRVSFELYPEQLEVVEEALREMSERSGKEQRSVCLEYICGEYLSGVDGSERAPAPREPSSAEEVEERLNALVAKLVELKGEDGALDAVVEVIDVRFPGADVDVRVK